MEGKHGAVIAIRCSADRLVTLHADLTVCTYNWGAHPDGSGAPFDLKPIKKKPLPCAGKSLSEEILGRQSYVPAIDGSTNDTSQRSPATAAEGFKTSYYHGGETTVPAVDGEKTMLGKFSRSLTRGLNFMREATTSNTPATPSVASTAPAAPAVAPMGGLYLRDPEVDGLSLPPPPSAFDEAGNKIQGVAYRV